MDCDGRDAAFALKLGWVGEGRGVEGGMGDGETEGLRDEATTKSKRANRGPLTANR